MMHAATRRQPRRGTAVRAAVRWLAAAAAWALACDARAAGTGLTGDYFNNADFTAKVTNRVDGTVSFDWGAGTPFASVAADTFSVRWHGQVDPEFSEEYTFYVTADDGARLWVDDRLAAVRTFVSPQQATLRARVRLEAGRKTNIRLEFIEQTGSARVRLEWSSPSRAREVIPSSRLYPVLVDRAGGSILAEHWTGIPGAAVSNLSAHAGYPARPAGREFLTAFECLATNWADSHGSRVTGYLVPPASGEYTFAVAGDDSVELRLSADGSVSNAQLIAWASSPTAFRQWDAAAGQISAPIALAQGERYFVELRHKDDTGPDHWSAAWMAPGETGFSVIPGSALLQAGLDRPAPAQTNILDTLAQEHPRLFASPQRFEWLRQQAAFAPSGKPAAWFRDVTNSARALAANPPVSYNPDIRDTILDTARAVLDRVSKWALTYRITGNAYYAERTWIELQHIATNFPDWNPGHFLDVAEMTHAHAVAYDWLYDYWTPERRAMLVTNIVGRGLNEGLLDYQGNASWTRTNANNWNAVCNGGMALGALAIGADDEAKAEDVLNRALASVRMPISRVTADNGAWYEGPGYWTYTFDYATRMYAGLENCLGSDFGVSSTRGMNEVGHFPIQASGPFLKSFNFADASDTSTRVGSAGMWYFARRFNQPLYAWWEHAHAGGSPLGALWWSSTGAPPASAAAPADIYFRGATATTGFKTVETAALRSAWGDTNATFLAFKGGEMGASHGNLDAGTFVLDALGKRWAWELGGDNYALAGYFSDTPSSGTDRWDYYRCRAEGQNTLVIGATNGPDMKRLEVAPVVLFQSEPSGDGSKAILDLSAVCHGASRVWRGYQLLGARNEVLIQDEIATASAQPVWWFMHIRTNGTQISVDPGGLSATITQGSARLWLRSLAEGAFYLTNAAPLATSPDPAGQNSNSVNYVKLAMHLPPATNVTMAVWMVPLRPGEEPPAAAPEVAPLSEWTATTNTPPLAADAAATTAEDAALDVDLRTLVSDAETPVEQMRFEVSGAASNGVVVLLADGHTARFTPAANYFGPAAFDYTAVDTAADPRAVLAYDFDRPDAADAGAVPDVSGNGRDGALEAIGAGAFSITNDGPAALGGWSARCLDLAENAPGGGARLSCNLPASGLDFNASDWTVCGWLKRRDRQNDDFVFYVGASDGFGGANELQLYGRTNSDTVTLQHYYGDSLYHGSPGAAVPTNTWRHFAAVRAGTNLSLFIGGQPAGSVADTHFAIPQGAVLFGGNSNTAAYVSRWFDGRLDDLAVFRAALASNEIVRLAEGMTVRHFGGARSGGSVAVSVLPVNDPVSAIGAATSVVRGAAVDIDLFALASDVESPDAGLLFSLGGAVNGSVSLLADGRTARFTPAPGYSGAASFQFTACDQGIEPRLLMHFDFEPPDDTADGVVSDASGSGRGAAIVKLAGGDAAFTNAVPAALAPFSARSMHLIANSGGACLRAPLAQAEYNLSTNGWTAALWFRRESIATEDFLFYMGAGDGFGDVNAIQLSGKAGDSRINLSHWDAASAQDVNITSPGGSAATGSWHHAAVTFAGTNAGPGEIRLYLDGALVGATNVAMNIDQVRPVAFGGHNHASANIARCLGGTLDDAALYAAALDAGDIAALATRTVAHHGGATATRVVNIDVITHFTAWQQLRFGAAWTNAAVAGESGDPDGDALPNLVEYGTGGNPMARGGAPAATQAGNGGRMAIRFSRDPAATDAILTVQAGGDLVGWTDIARGSGGGSVAALLPGIEVVETPAGGLVRVEVRDAGPMSGHARRFLRLVVGR